MQRGLSIANHLASTDNLTKTTNTHEHIAEYNHTKNPYYATIHNEYMQENPRINRQDRQKITFPGSAYSLPQRDLPAVHSRYTQNQCTVRLSSWGLPSLSLTTKGSWIHLVGRVAKPLVSPLTPSPPPPLVTRVRDYLLTNFQLSMPFSSRLRLSHGTDRQTDRRRPSMLNAMAAGYINGKLPEKPHVSTKLAVFNIK